MTTERTTQDRPLLPLDADATAGATCPSQGSVGSEPPDSEVDRAPFTSLQMRLHASPTRTVRLGRYEVRRVIGSGGMGVVYEAFNVEHGQRVALKTLRAPAGAGLGRFKREFRFLAKVAHPNLVQLHELLAVDGEWFITMEYVDGPSFTDHAQEGTGRARPYLGETLETEVRAHTAPDARSMDVALRAEPGRGRAERLRPRFHEGRLRAALRQLGAGVAALHARGLVHRDINSANVLVTAEGRVVVLDFGLVVDTTRGRAPLGISGTPGYMAPEQAAGKPATPASDWYAVGVMLFEALTGSLPFHGSSPRILTLKQQREAVPPSALVTGVPADLDDLCAALLRRRAEARPAGDEVLRRLGAASRPPPSVDGPSFFGRRDELAMLDAALAEAERGRVSIAHVHGPPGTGKTALAARFCEGAVVRRQALVLRGAVSAREAIPHRALDALVDALADHLATLQQPEASAILPPGSRELARVFPAFGAIVARADPPPSSGGPVEARAFAALAEILRHLARAAPLVLWIDDVDQAEPTDLARLSALVASLPARGRAPLCLLSGGAEVLSAPAGVPLEVRAVRVDPLPPGEARALSREALRRAGATEARAAEVARSAAGTPRLIHDLASWIAREGLAAPPSLDAMIAAHLDRLPDAALRLVEVLAAARGPVPQALALAVAGLAGSPAVDTVSLLARLSGERLVRARGLAAYAAVEIHDDRVRAVVASRIAPALLARIHLDLAAALAQSPGVDPALAAIHLHLGGAGEEAVEQAARAAERAAAGRDLDQAARLFALALEWATQPRAHALAVRRAEVLSAAGRAAEAARAFLGAAASARGPEALDLRRRAAEHLLVSGRTDEGLALLRPVLNAHGLRWPESPRTAMLLLAAGVVKLRLRGTALPATPSPDADPALIEAAWSAAKGLAPVDPVRSAVFMVEALLAALAAGDVARTARALAFVGCLFVYDGGAADERRGDAFIEEAAHLARRAGDPYLEGLVRCVSGLSRLCTGRWREALARVDEGLALLEEAFVDAAWERHAYRVVAGQALFALGALRERSRRAERWLAEARDRGDKLGEVEARNSLAAARLAAGDAARARAEVREAITRISGARFSLQHHGALWVEVSALLHQGHAAAAWARLMEAWPALAGSQLLRVQLVRVDAWLLRGAAAAACAAMDEARADTLLAEADAAAARLAREHRAHAQAAAAVVRAAAAWARGDAPAAVTRLAEAASGYDACEMKLHAAGVRRAAGGLLGGPEGAAMVAKADELLAKEGIVETARWVRMWTGITS
jgi:serine/threonine protein kinase